MIFSQDLQFAFEHKHVFNGISISSGKEITNAGIIALLGPSGSGKTTLLRLFAGLLEPGSGEIKKIGTKGAGISWAFQEPRLVPWLSVRKNCLVQSYGKKKPSVSLLEQCAKDLEIYDALDLFPKDLSGGMKSRASLLRSILHQEPWFFWDEPFSALDRPLRNRLLPLLRNKILSMGSSCMVVLHDAEDARIFADYSLLLPSSGHGVVTLSKVLRTPS